MHPLCSHFSLLLLTLVLSNCAMVRYNTHEDQMESMKHLGSVPVTKKVNMPEMGHSASYLFSPDQFIPLHSGVIVSGAYADRSVLEEQLGFNRKSTDERLTLKFNLPLTKKGTGGACAIISKDGYLLTANHVLTGRDTFVILPTIRNGATILDYASCWLIHRNKSADFAILKADIPTPWWLHIRKSPIIEDEVVYGGGWLHKRAAGTFRKRTQKRDGSSRITTTLPMIQGDSGSPLIDGQGRLCGIMSEMTLGIAIKMNPPIAVATMIPPEQIRSIIELDRDRIRYSTALR